MARRGWTIRPMAELAQAVRTWGGSHGTEERSRAATRYRVRRAVSQSLGDPAVQRHQHGRGRLPPVRLDLVCAATVETAWPGSNALSGGVHRLRAARDVAGSV